MSDIHFPMRLIQILYWPALTLRRILDTSFVVHRRSSTVSHERSGCLVLVWPQWQVELMALVDGDAEEELQAISIREYIHGQLQQQASARPYELILLSYKEVF
jgi:hypothetical protein